GGAPRGRGERPGQVGLPPGGGLHDRLVRPYRGGPPHRSLPAQGGLPADRGGPGAVLPARGQRPGLGLLRVRAGVHGVSLRGDPVHRRDDRAVRRRPHALAGGRHAPGRLLRGQRPRGVRARPDREGGPLPHPAGGHGRHLRVDHALRLAAARPRPRSRRGGLRAGAGALTGARDRAMPDPAFRPEEHRLAAPRWFDDLAVGERFPIPSRTMTEALFAAFQLASADNHPIHYDREYCRAHGHRDLLAHGLLVTAQAAAGAGIFPHAISDSLVAFLDQSSRFLKPVYVGDTLYPLLTITRLEPGRTTGVVAMRATVHNHAGELVMEGEHRYLLRRKPPA